jgi:hypothetical protein
MSFLISASAFASVATCFPCSASSFSSDHPAPTKLRLGEADERQPRRYQARRDRPFQIHFDQVEVAARDERTVIAISA